MSLQQITALISGQLKRHVTSYQMSKLTGPGTGPAALRILTELALALDARDIPVSYNHRRDLAASTTLIGDTTWAWMVRDAGMRADPRRHAQNARRYLYELLTSCCLRTAPPPYQVTTASAQAGYNTFTISMTTDLASALDDHARRILATWGITSEPLQWQPPATWVTATTWPGADPAETDPAPVHRALLRDHARPHRGQPGHLHRPPAPGPAPPPAAPPPAPGRAHPHPRDPAR